MLYRKNRRYTRLLNALNKASERHSKALEDYSKGICTLDELRAFKKRLHTLSDLVYLAMLKSFYRMDQVIDKLSEYAFSIHLLKGMTLFYKSLLPKAHHYFKAR